jgi:hypothetical protein
VHDFARLIGPLQALLTAGKRLIPAGKKANMNSAVRVPLSACGWGPEHVKAYRDVLAALARNVTMAYPSAPSAGFVRTVWCDASNEHWSGCVTECTPETLDLPVDAQSHRLLAVVSGTFRGAETRWPTIQQESAASVYTVTRCQHLLRGHHFHLFTDSKTLSYYLDPMSAAANKQHEARISRWLMVLGGYDYTVHHTPGITNHVSDMYSRWAHADSLQEPTVVTIARVITRAQERRAVLAAAAQPAPVPDAPVAAGPPDAPAPAAAPLQAPPELGVASPPAGAALHPAQAAVVLADVISASQAYGPDDLPLESEVVAAQRAHVHGDVPGCVLVDTVWRTAEGQLFVPDACHLRLRFCVGVHAGAGAHRGAATTLAHLEQFVWWPGIKTDCNVFVRACLFCARAKGARVIPRPLLTAVSATEINELLFMDFLFIRRAKPAHGHSFEHILVLQDAFSRWCELVPVEHCDAASAVTALQWWQARFHGPRTLLTDRGSHFANSLMEEYIRRTGLKHAFTIAHASWSQPVERRHRDVLAALRALLGEMKLDEAEWPYLLTTVMTALNSAPSSVLAGHAPCTVYLGRTPTTPLSVVYRPGVHALAELPAPAAAVERVATAIQTRLDEVRAAARAQQARPKPTRPGEQEDDLVTDR